MQKEPQKALKFFITGGAGFIGSAVIRLLISKTNHQVLNFDKLTYAGNLQSLETISKSPRYRFVLGDICDRAAVSHIFQSFEPDVVMHLAAESHVDRSIYGSEQFIQTNIIGTWVLLECALNYWKNLPSNNNFRFHHISTDEVYGSLDGAGQFTEDTAYDPSSPYSATKASADHLVRAWYRTYGLPVVITNCSNNYGPYQFPEKLIPLMIINAISGKLLPIYGDGKQVRDWLYVEDHADALYKVASEGMVGAGYNIGGHNERTNLEVVHEICDLLGEMLPINQSSINYRDQIAFVSDRPGHDWRYAINANKISVDLGWTPSESFGSGLRKTVAWYLKNENWWRQVQIDSSRYDISLQ